ncbi:MAG: class I SAM-dependent methyltransferase [Clostridiales bacterium]|nr:class I SAM-dependent methyltransferase [Clostridiales bacterium]
MIEIRAELAGSILDIGGGGEAVIGRAYGERVLAIDISQEELDEAPDCCRKRRMDATDLQLPDKSFDNVTFFYSLMYMTEEEQRRALGEAARVLKRGGCICIWDTEIDSAYPEPFEIELDIRVKDTVIHTVYGVVKRGRQSFGTIQQFLQCAGMDIAAAEKKGAQFYMKCRKRR